MVDEESLENYIRRTKPEGVDYLSSEETQWHLDRFNNLVAERLVSIPSDRVPSKIVYWPKPPLLARAIPEGVMPLDCETGDDHDVCLERFISLEKIERIVFWVIDAPYMGKFKGRYNSETRSFIKSMVLTPVVLMSEKNDILIISDDDLHYSVVGGPREAIDSLEGAFGGGNVIRDNFYHWLDEYGIDTGEAWRQWGYEYLAHWSGWS